MPRPRVAMRKIRDVLRLDLRRGAQPPPGRPVARHPVHDRRPTTSVAAKAAGLAWPLPDDLDDAGLEALLFPPSRRPTCRVRCRTGPTSTASCGERA